MPTAAAAFLPTFISFGDDDDDDFGEFEFAAVPVPASASSWSSSPIPPPHCATSSQQKGQQAAGEEDDDWGDFVESPLQPQPFSSSDTPPPPPPPPPSSSSSSAHFSSFFDPFSAPPTTTPDPAPIGPVPPDAGDRGWQKPSGALPLSLFGEDDVEDGGGEESSNSLDPQISALKGGMLASSKSPVSNGLVSAQGGGFKDLIASLYGHADKVGPATAGNSDGSGDNSKIHSGSGANSNFADGGDNDEDEVNKSCREFNDALSSTRVGDSGDCVLVEKEGELAGVPGVEAKAADSGAGFQASGNYILKSNGQKCENMLGANLPSRVLSDEQEWGNAFVSHDTTVNGFDFRSADNGCNGCSSDAHHDFEHINIENGLNPNVVNGDMSLDDSLWEFKDASSNIEVVDSFTEPESIGQVGLNELENLYMSTCGNENQDFSGSFLIIEGCPYVPNSIDNGTEDVKAGSVVGLNDLVSNMYNVTCNISAVSSKHNTHSEQNSAVSRQTLEGADNIDLMYAGLESDKIKDNKFVFENMDTYLNISTEPAVFVDFYSRLKQKSCTLALHHIDSLKLRETNEKEVPDEELKAVYLDDEIKAAFSKLGVGAFESDHIEKCPPNECSVSELLEVLQKPGFQAFDTEYSLSEKISLAEKDLSSAMWLFEHASYILRILTLASYEEQRTYIISWSKMVSACEKELQHGAEIWSQALHANIQTELLSASRGQQYFLALGEIYRVVEILSASIRLYKAWILLNPADSRELLAHIKKSVEAWIDSALKQALEMVSESFGELKLVTEELLESIKFISKLSTRTLQNHLSNHEARFCRLCLLPLEMLPDIQQVVWHDDHYSSKPANLWANRISCDAPQLPHIHVGQ